MDQISLYILFHTNIKISHLIRKVLQTEILQAEEVSRDIRKDATRPIWHSRRESSLLDYLPSNKNNRRHELGFD